MRKIRRSFPESGTKHQKTFKTTNTDHRTPYKQQFFARSPALIFFQNFIPAFFSISDTAKQERKKHIRVSAPHDQHPAIARRFFPSVEKLAGKPDIIDILQQFINVTDHIVGYDSQGRFSWYGFEYVFQFSRKNRQKTWQWKTDAETVAPFGFCFGDFSRFGKRFNRAYPNVWIKRNDLESVCQVLPLNGYFTLIFLNISPEIRLLFFRSHFAQFLFSGKSGLAIPSVFPEFIAR